MDSDSAIEWIRSDIADGHLNDEDDWLEWPDRLIFREEQRAIGEMLVAPNNTIVGYAAFTSILAARDLPVRTWLAIASDFLIDTDTKVRDFRVVRLLRLTVHLLDLIKLLDSSRMPSYGSWLRGKAYAELKKYKVALPLR